MRIRLSMVVTAHIARFYRLIFGGDECGVTQAACMLVTLTSEVGMEFWIMFCGCHVSRRLCGLLSDCVWCW